jgi:hypothetical protein
MDVIIEVLQAVGIKYNVDDIRVKLENTTPDKILKEYLGECYFWFYPETNLLSLTESETALKLQAYDCYKLFGVETLLDLTEKNQTFVY